MKSIKKLLNQIVSKLEKNKKLVIICSSILLIGLLGCGTFLICNSYKTKLVQPTVEENNENAKTTTNVEVDIQQKSNSTKDEVSSELSDKELEDLLTSQNEEDDSQKEVTNETNEDIKDVETSTNDETTNIQDSTKESDSPKESDFPKESDSQEQTTPPISEKPTSSGFDKEKAAEIIYDMSSYSTNNGDPDTMNALNTYVENQFGENVTFDAEKLKSDFLNYTYKDTKVVSAVDVEVITMPDNFVTNDFLSKLKSQNIIDYLNIKTYYNVSDKTYTIYYIDATVTMYRG